MARICYGIVQDQEEKQGWRYEFLNRLRPDMIFHSDIAKHGMIQEIARDGFVHNFDQFEKTRMNGMADHFAL
jgi:hypothetical protein